MEPWRAAAERKACLGHSVQSQAWQLLGCRQPWAEHPRAKGGGGLTKMAWWHSPQLEIITHPLFLCLFSAFWWKKKPQALAQNPFGARLLSQLLFTKSCYSLNSMVFLWSSFLDIISSCLWCCKSGCTQGQKYPSRWFPELSLQHGTGSARPGHSGTHQVQYLVWGTRQCLLLKRQLQNAMNDSVLLRWRKIPFSLNKSNTHHPRPIAIKFQFYFGFVLHTHFPTHMMAYLSKYWVNSVSWEPTL